MQQNNNLYASAELLWHIRTDFVDKRIKDQAIKGIKNYKPQNNYMIQIWRTRFLTSLYTALLLDHYNSQSDLNYIKSSFHERDAFLQSRLIRGNTLKESEFPISSPM
jgi:hypothetical protein